MFCPVLYDNTTPSIQTLWENSFFIWPAVADIVLVLPLETRAMETSEVRVLAADVSPRTTGSWGCGWNVGRCLCWPSCCCYLCGCHRRGGLQMSLLPIHTSLLCVVRPLTSIDQASPPTCRGSGRGDAGLLLHAYAAEFSVSFFLVAYSIRL